MKQPPDPRPLDYSLMETNEALARTFKARDLRAKSDALLKLCGHICDWAEPRHHPYKSIDDAVHLAEAMGLRIISIEKYLSGWSCKMHHPDRFVAATGPTIAEAISEAIAEAVKAPQR